MANFGDLIGAFMQSGMSPTGQQRMGNALEDLVRTGLGSIGGGAQPGAAGAPASTQTAAPPAAQPGAAGGMGSLGGAGGLGDILGQVMGAIQGGGAAGQSGATPGQQPGGMGGLGDILGQVMGAAQGGLSNAARNPAQAGGLGAILGGLLGGGGDSVKGALGGGALAVLASIAFKALQGAGQGGQAGANLPGLTAPQTPTQAQLAESTAQLVLKGMINAAKADGEIDPAEMQRIVGKLQEAGMDEQTRAWVLNEMSRPLDLDAFAAEIPGQEASAQIYAASLLAIEVDTDAERAYLAEFAQKTGLHPMVAQHIQQSMGLTA
jgi:uncharacterized membrane protein YebE (DUF533 family)